MSAFYRAALDDFLSHKLTDIVGCLSCAYQHNELQRRQIKAWEKEIAVLKSALGQVVHAVPEAKNWSLLLEYPIPRRHKRLDGVLLASHVILCFEFKTEDKAYTLAAQRQVEEYALDLRDFHEASRNRCIVPIVIAPNAPTCEYGVPTNFHEVSGVLRANSSSLHEVVLTAFRATQSANVTPIDHEEWNQSPYRPVPTIIEAAEALYAGHDVREITHSHASAINLTETTDRLVEVIQEAQRDREKVICFVTGVPGAGKTLAGLNVVHNAALRMNDRPAGVFLSGNGPLVRIVSAAIARDHKRRIQRSGGERTVSTLIQNVHAFVREGLDKPEKLPPEHVIVFDEAQRAWNVNQNRKKNGIDVSEPHTVLEIMNRHHDWAVVVALVGGGQEIHNGEAGLIEWGRTLREKFQHWRIVVSPKALVDDPSNAGFQLFEDGTKSGLNIQTEPSLHLEVSQRSFRARKVTEWVDAALNLDSDRAASIKRELRDFPIALTRSLETTRKWLREHTRGQRRCGLVASSGAMRLRADGIELSSGFRQGNRDLYVNWFLNELPDIRSSNQLEVAASEFECQGLELDWVGICWGGDLTFDLQDRGWVFRNLAGTRWGNVRDEVDRTYLLNTYRVLLTRARQGFVIWVPPGDAADHTRPREWFDQTVDYLTNCGLVLI